VHSIRCVVSERVSVRRVNNVVVVRVDDYIRPGKGRVQPGRGGDVGPGGTAVSRLINARIGATQSVLGEVVHGRVGDLVGSRVNRNLPDGQTVENSARSGRKGPARTAVRRHQNARAEIRIGGVIGLAGAG